MSGAPWSVTWQSKTVCTIKINLNKADSELDVLLASDQHHDHPNANRKLEIQHLQTAKDRGSPILFGGDTLCVMQQRDDPRGSIGKILPQHYSANYLDLVVQSAADFYEPFAENIVLMGHGNHETKILKRSSVDLTAGMVRELRHRNDKAIIRHGWYAGWVRFQLMRGRQSQSYWMFRHHGPPGTKMAGKAGMTFMASTFPDASIIWSGHHHTEYIVPTPTHRISLCGVQFDDRVWHIKTPGYKSDFQDGAGGFTVEKIASPQTNGAAWLKFYRRRSNTGKGSEVFGFVPRVARN